MKKFIIILLMLPAGALLAQHNPVDSSTKAVLLQQLKETHDMEAWFVPLHTAIQDLTPEQALWKPDDSSHSIVQLVTHLMFWNTRVLHSFAGEQDPRFEGDNTETFSNLGADQWKAIVRRSDSLSAAWEQAVRAHTGGLTAEQAELVAHVSTHNAYHTGQIMYVRKQQRAWNRSKTAP